MTAPSNEHLAATMPPMKPTAPADPRAHNLGKKLMQGSLWMILMRLSSRVVGLASMVVVARLLVPADFGLFAVATAAVALVDALTDVGTELAIIKHPDPQRSHYDTAWTFNVLLHGCAGIAVLVFALFSASLYGDPRYEGVFVALGASIMLNGLKNIGTVDFRRNLQFEKDFKYTFIVQVIGVLVTLVTAILLRSYWALVLGVLARGLTGLTLSYTMSAYRPRLSLSARAEMAGFSFWTLLRSVAIFLMLAGDRLVLGMYYDAATVGLYAIASSLAAMAVTELLSPIGRALLPGMSIKQGDKEWERRNLPIMFGGTATIAIFMATLASALAEPIISIIYGAKFAAAAPMLSVLVWWAALGGAAQPAGHFLLVAGKMREIAIFFIIEGILSVSAAFGLSHYGYGIDAVIYAKVLISSCALLRVVLFLKDFPHLRFADLLLSWAKPLLAAAISFGLTRVALHQLPLHPLAALPIGLLVLTASFAGTLILLWRLAGRPEGFENEVAVRVKARLGT